MRKTVVTAALVAAAVTAPAAPSAAADRVSLGGVRVVLGTHTRQVVTVDRTRGYHARVGYWVLRHDAWTRVYDVRDGRIGYGGLVGATTRVQGTGTTPLGTVRLISAFGRHPRPAGWDLPYRRIQRGDYWVEDNRSPFYNRYRTRAQGGFRWWIPAGDTNSSERLTDFPQQYEYSVVTSYNHDQVRHRGAGIFLHVNGPGATAGCVSAPRRFLRRLMWRLDPAEHPVMAVGR
ncbi:L,D-transpeptidase family protein [Nocardioides cynanchi]|uniref:L,D-transpeptidase family protein n=1 Tax=Nocardioides cynanchi TaxID=2558918 RepID=UPI0012489ECA|nr:L,D-transpeptidase family protein [Nocardioides cynanchi]